MNDAGVGRHYGEVLERGLAPAQEGVALLVALEFQFGIELKRLRGTVLIHLHRVVITNSAGCSGLIRLGIAAQRLHGIAHRSQVNHCGYTREILQQHAARHERNLLHGDGLARPRSERAHVVGLYGLAVFAAQQVLQ